MKFKTLFLTFAALVTSVGLVKANEAEDQIIDATIELARGFLGEDEALDSVTSIHYQGSLLYSSGDSGTIDVMYQKPMYQKIVATINDTIEISALDDTEGWIMYKAVQNDQPLGMEIFDPIRILSMQAGVREAFSFFERPTHRGSSLTYAGQEKVNGRNCVVLHYDHGEGIAYRRYIDSATGELVKTVDTKGVEYFQEGEIIVDGIKFPQKLITRFQTAIGPQTMEFSYKSIEINKVIPKSEFEMPIPGL